MNCHAPETGNIELLAKYCTPEQKKKWLHPLMNGDMSSAYSMTEPDVASSDATQVGIKMEITDKEVIINGRKLYGNCQYNPEMQLFILMGCSDPDNANAWNRHTTLVVPANSPGLKQVRNLTIMGYDWAPEGHGEYIYENVRVPKENIILGPGRAFEIAQGRLGPGRIHHCMRLIGQSERAYELALVRCMEPRKKPRGKFIGDFDSNIERIADMRMTIDSMRLVVLNAADTMDLQGNKAGKYAIAQSKILVPNALLKVIDEAMQMYGGQGLTQHTPLPEIWTYARFVRVADGPDSARIYFGTGRQSTRRGIRSFVRSGAWKQKNSGVSCSTCRQVLGVVLFADVLNRCQCYPSIVFVYSRSSSSSTWGTYAVRPCLAIQIRHVRTRRVESCNLGSRSFRICTEVAVFDILVHHRVDPFVPHFSIRFVLFTRLRLANETSITVRYTHAYSWMYICVQSII
jgi:acyl-CoA dehydrogenase